MYFSKLWLGNQDYTEYEPGFQEKKHSFICVWEINIIPISNAIHQRVSYWWASPIYYVSNNFGVTKVFVALWDFLRSWKIWIIWFIILLSNKHYSINEAEEEKINILVELHKQHIVFNLSGFKKIDQKSLKKTFA